MLFSKSKQLKNVDNIHLVSLGALLNMDDSFIHLLEAPIGATYERDENGIFVEVEED